jgi:hypothetical protein
MLSHQSSYYPETGSAILKWMFFYPLGHKLGIHRNISLSNKNDLFRMRPEQAPKSCNMHEEVSYIPLLFSAVLIAFFSSTNNVCIWFKIITALISRK